MFFKSDGLTWFEVIYNVSDPLFSRSHWLPQCLCLLGGGGGSSQWCKILWLLTNESMKGEIVSVLPPVTTSPRHLRVCACWRLEVLLYTAVVFMFYPVELGKWWRQFCFLLSGCQGQLSGVLLGGRGKTTHTRKWGNFVVSGTVGTSFWKYWYLW